MREIKFRALLRNQYFKGWVYCNILDGFRGIDVDINTICQYTGLKDKNGKEIYEGDIIRYQYLNTLEQEMRISEVKLLSIGDVNRNIQAYYPFCYSISGSYKERDREITECYLTPANDCEVIGNIYENKELLSE